MGTELELTEEDVGLNERQIRALDQLSALGKAPRATPDEPYDKDPKVRALQLVYENRLGGPNRGQGRKKERRASEIVAEHIRNKKSRRLIQVLDEALDDEDPKIRLKAFDMAVSLEREEAKIAIQEDQADIENATREELLATLLTLAGDQSVASVIEATAEGHIDLSEDDFEEVELVGDDEHANSDDGGWSDEAAPDPPATRNHSRAARRNGRGRASQSGENGPNPFTQAAKRRAAKR